MQSAPLKPELINVHKVFASKDIIAYLRLGDQDVTEGLFYQAKRWGRVTFAYRGRNYDIVKNKDGSFSINISPEQDINTEEYA